MRISKSIVSTVWHRRLALHQARWLHKHNRQFLRILAYHRILEPPPEFALDPGVISATPAGFREQMEFIREHFTAIGFRDLAAIVDQRQPVPPNPIVITFDDGYRDNYLNAFPILRELNLPAVFFIVTGHMGTARMFWWDQIAFIVGQTTETRCRLDAGDGEREWPLRDAVERTNFRLAILSAVKSLPDGQKTRLMDQLQERLQVRDLAAHYEEQLCTWDHLREMARGGMEFGSHTRWHPVLANVTPERLQEEIEGSRADLRRELAEEPLALAYPIGGLVRYNQHVLVATEQAGYRFGITYQSGLNALSHMLPYQLSRIRVEAQDRLDDFTTRVVFTPPD